jgi:hypothetical protein
MCLVCVSLVRISLREWPRDVGQTRLAFQLPQSSTGAPTVNLPRKIHTSSGPLHPPRIPVLPAMSSSDLSLRHLPDLSDASFSFQIPVDSGDNLLHGDSDDFFGGGTSPLASPSSLRANDAPLTLSDLTPIVNAIPAEAGPKPPQKSTKSLLTTTRSDIQDLAGSQTASRVPKPVSATHRKPKHVVAALNEIPVHTISVLPSKMVPTSDRSKDALNNENAISPSVHAKQTGPLSTAPGDFSFQLHTTPPAPSIPVSVEDTVKAQAASLDSKVNIPFKITVIIDVPPTYNPLSLSCVRSSYSPHTLWLPLFRSKTRSKLTPPRSTRLRSRTRYRRRNWRRCIRCPYRLCPGRRPRPR